MTMKQETYTKENDMIATLNPMMIAKFCGENRNIDGWMCSCDDNMFHKWYGSVYMNFITVGCIST